MATPTLQSTETSQIPISRTYGPTTASGQAVVIQGDYYAPSSREQIDPTKSLRDALKYKDQHARAEQLSSENVSIASVDWIWEGDFLTWLESPGQIFWITGKPGSGKSTLVNYLVKSQKTRDVLARSSNGQDYKILYFYFDYRSRFSAANDQSGLVRALLLQLCDHFEKAEEKLVRQHSREPLDQVNTVRLFETLCDILAGIPQQACCFIDGLDEYEGEYLVLGQMILNLAERTKIRLCIASRPETTFRYLFENVPSLMIQDHNDAAILASIKYRLNQKRTNISIGVSLTIFDEDMCSKLVERAQGVMIWARFAVDALLQGATEVMCRENLVQVLDQLPQELHALYERALEKRENLFTSEAAVLLCVINELGGSVPMTLLYSLWSFLRDFGIYGGSSFTPYIKEARKFSDHTQNLLEPLIEIVHISSMHPDEARAIHKTVQPFIHRSKVIQQRLPHDIVYDVKNYFELRLCSRIIKTATECFRTDSGKLPKYVSEGWLQELYLYLEPGDPVLGTVLHGSRLEEHNEVLYWSTWRISSLAKDFVAGSYLLWNDILSSPFTLLNIGDLESIHHLSTRPQHNHLVTAMLCGMMEYLEMSLDLDSDELNYDYPLLLHQCLYVLVHKFVPNWMSARGRLRQLPRVKQVLKRIALRCNLIRIGKPMLCNEKGDTPFVPPILETVEWDEQIFKVLYEIVLSTKALPLLPDDTFSNDARQKFCDCSDDEHIIFWWLFTFRDAWSTLPNFHLAKLVLWRSIAARPNFNLRCERYGSLFHFAYFLSFGRQPKKSGQNTEPTTEAWMILLAKLGVDPLIKHNGRRIQDYFLEKSKKSSIKSLLRRNKSKHWIVKVFENFAEFGTWPDLDDLVRKHGLGEPASWHFSETGQPVLDDYDTTIDLEIDLEIDLGRGLELR